MATTTLPYDIRQGFASYLLVITHNSFATLCILAKWPSSWLNYQKWSM